MDEVILAVLDRGKQYDISIIPEGSSINALIDYAKFSRHCGFDFNKCLEIVVDYHKATLLEPKELSLNIKNDSGELDARKRKVLEGIVGMHNNYVLQADSLKAAKELNLSCRKD